MNKIDQFSSWNRFTINIAKSPQFYSYVDVCLLCVRVRLLYRRAEIWFSFYFSYRASVVYFGIFSTSRIVFDKVWKEEKKNSHLNFDPMRLPNYGRFFYFLIRCEPLIQTKNFSMLIKLRAYIALTLCSFVRDFHVSFTCLMSYFTSCLHGYVCAKWHVWHLVKMKIGYVLCRAYHKQHARMFTFIWRNWIKSFLLNFLISFVRTFFTYFSIYLIFSPWNLWKKKTAMKSVYSFIFTCSSAFALTLLSFFFLLCAERGREKTSRSFVPENITLFCSGVHLMSICILFVHTHALSINGIMSPFPRTHFSWSYSPTAADNKRQDNKKCWNWKKGDFRHHFFFLAFEAVKLPKIKYCNAFCVRSYKFRVLSKILQR